MNKTRLLGLAIGFAVIIAAIFVFQVISTKASANSSFSPGIARGNDPLHEPHQANSNVTGQGNSAPISITGNAPTAGPALSNCFSTAYHAADDCDRLASAPFLLQMPGSNSYGPSIKDCFSGEYHAATDCDRDASGINYP